VSELQLAMDAMARLAAPGPGHARLEPLLGAWQTTTSMWVDPARDPLQTHGSATRSWILGGRFLQEDLSGRGPDGTPYAGRLLTGFDNGAQRYTGIWISDGATSLSPFSGRFDDASQTFVFLGDEPDPTGAGPARAFRRTLQLQPEGQRLTQTYRLPDGAELRAFAIDYRRA